MPAEEKMPVVAIESEPSMTTELLERVKHIEGMLAQLIEANGQEVEEHERWKRGFDAQVKNFERSLDEIEVLRKDLESSTKGTT
jgi:hypothetical protein